MDVPNKSGVDPPLPSDMVLSVSGLCARIRHHFSADIHYFAQNMARREDSLLLNCWHCRDGVRLHLFPIILILVLKRRGHGTKVVTNDQVSVGRSVGELAVAATFNLSCFIPVAVSVPKEFLVNSGISNSSDSFFSVVGMLLSVATSHIIIIFIPHLHYRRQLTTAKALKTIQMRILCLDFIDSSSPSDGHWMQTHSVSTLYNIILATVYLTNTNNCYYNGIASLSIRGNVQMPSAVFLHDQKRHVRADRIRKLQAMERTRQ
jgi:hypothetical protein